MFRPTLGLAMVLSASLIFIGCNDRNGSDAGADGGMRADTGTGDSGGTDSGRTDSGGTDSGGTDGGTDGGGTDGGGTDGAGIDGGFDAAFDAGTDPVVTSVDYPVIAHGGQLVISGFNLGGATAVDIGGTSHTNLSGVTTTSVTLDAVSESTMVGASVRLSVTTPGGATPDVMVTVVHLQINEIDIDTPGSDLAEFVELDIGFDGVVSLDGYVFAHFNGASVMNLFDVDLGASGAMTNAMGILLIGEDGTAATPDLRLPDALQQDGEEIGIIYQFPGDISTFPGDLATAGTTGVIDALIWDGIGIEDVAAFDAFVIGAARDVNEAGGPTPSSQGRQTTSIQRCQSGALRDSDTFLQEIPTPGQPNIACSGPVDVSACPIDFNTSCPDSNPGICGAVFQGHQTAMPAMCHTIGGVTTCYDSGSPSFHAFDGDSQVDIFFSGNVAAVSLFLAPFMGTTARLTAFDIDGNAYPAETEANDCATVAITERTYTFTPTAARGPVRRIRIDDSTADNHLWIDTFIVNP